jgi:hypothetical protein
MAGNDEFCLGVQVRLCEPGFAYHFHLAISVNERRKFKPSVAIVQSQNKAEVGDADCIMSDSLWNVNTERPVLKTAVNYTVNISQVCPMHVRNAV